MKHQKPLIRRTFLQERFEILIKKQKNGDATFNELTELDEIVNRDPGIRYIILEEMSGNDAAPNDHPAGEINSAEQGCNLHFLEKIKAFIDHLLRCSSLTVTYVDITG